MAEQRDGGVDPTPPNREQLAADVEQMKATLGEVRSTEPPRQTYAETPPEFSQLAESVQAYGASLLRAHRDTMLVIAQFRPETSALLMRFSALLMADVARELGEAIERYGADAATRARRELLDTINAMGQTARAEGLV